MSWPGIIDTLVLHIDPHGFKQHSTKGFARKQIQGRNSEGTDYFYFNQYYNEPGLNLSINAWGLLLFLHTPQFAGRENNLVLADERDLEFCCKKLEAVLDKLTITISPISDLNIIRIDLAKDILCNQPFSSYKQVFESLHYPRMGWRQEKGSYLFKNSIRQFIFYDKRSQIKTKGVMLEGDLMRGELKLLKREEVKKYGISTYGDLMSDYSRLHKIYSNFVSKLFVEMPLDIVEDQVERKLRLISQRGWKDSKKILLWSSLRDVPYEQLKLALSESEKESQVYNLLRERKDYMQDILVLGDCDGTQFASYYNELRSKFLSMEFLDSESWDSHA